MNINYDWKITALKKAPTLDGLSNVITNIKFDKRRGALIIFVEGNEVRIRV